jgi:hypothetical protein
MFHVKHSGAGVFQTSMGRFGTLREPQNPRIQTWRAHGGRQKDDAGQGAILFSDAEVPKNNIQNILNIDPACHAAKRAGRNAEFFRQ